MATRHGGLRFPLKGRKSLPLAGTRGPGLAVTAPHGSTRPDELVQGSDPRLRGVAYRFSPGGIGERPGSLPVVHNETTGKQGGNGVDEFYHVPKLTAGVVAYADANGVLTGDANLTWSGDLLTVNGQEYIVGPCVADRGQLYIDGDTNSDHAYIHINAHTNKDTGIWHMEDGALKWAVGYDSSLDLFRWYCFVGTAGDRMQLTDAGNLTLTIGNLYLKDDKKAVFGTDLDVAIWFDGTDLVIG